MRLKARILIIINTALLVPIILYLMFWFLLTVVLVLNGEASNILLILFFVLVFILLYSILSAVRLKLTILKDVGDNFLKPIKAEYWSATFVNIGGYMVFYPLLIALLFNAAIAGLFILLAIIISLPLLKKIRKTQARYNSIKKQMKVGKFWCPDCRISMFWSIKTNDWVCYKCKAKEKYQGKYPFLLDWI